MIKSLQNALLLILLLAPAARADVDAGLDWLQARDSVDGVHRPGDISSRVDTNAEAWLTVETLGAPARFPGLAQTSAESADESLFSQARQAVTRLTQGISVDASLDAMLQHQQSDGGFSSHPGFASDVATTAWVLTALDRAGRGAQTPAQRALSYLIGAQHAEGGWSATTDGSFSTLTTATAANALVRFESRFVIEDPLARAESALLAAREPDASFGEVFETAAAVEALVALRAPREQLQVSVDALSELQQADGSFNGDAFETALALRALHVWQQPVIDPDLGSLVGRVLADDTGLPITGASLTLQGEHDATLVSNNRGELFSSSLAAGAYTARLEFIGMRTLEFQLTLVGGRTLDMGDLRMYQGSSPSGDFGLIRGVVTSSETGEPIEGAVIRLEAPPNEVVADADGRYQFLQVPVGEVRVNADAPGYSSVASVITLQPFSIVDLSLRLTPRAEPIPGSLVRGVVRHGETEEPLAGVQVAVVSGAPATQTLTADDGSYELGVDANGIVEVMATLDGFDPVDMSSLLVPDQILGFSPEMYPTGQTPEGANSSTISGVVVNRASQAPLENTLVLVTDSSGQQSMSTDDHGAFSFTDLTGPTVSISLSRESFDTVSLVVPILPLQDRNLGTISLKPTALEFYFPDLTIVASSLAETDPDDFSMSQEFEVEIANKGTSGLTQDFTLLAFVDANGNGIFDEPLEPEVGSVRVSDDLTIGGSVDARIAVSAQLSFRDAPIAFVVDAEHEVSEQDENNNTGSSLLGCRAMPAFVGDDNIYEAWRWSGLASDPQVNSLNQVPVVGQLTDDNGDGVINEYDIPDLAFVAGRRSSGHPGKTALVAISGDDGRELWSRTDLILSHFSSLALGDIDNDGVAEIIAVRGYRSEVIAFENDGSLKWRRALRGPEVPIPPIPPPAYVYDAPVIVNLEGDNEAEVVLGRLVLRGSTGEILWEGEHDAGGEGGLPSPHELQIAGGIGSITADINLDGVMEVIAGRSAYDVEGRTLWHRGDIKPEIAYDFHPFPRPLTLSGSNAVGNFDLDDFPEVVLSIGDELYLLDHNGGTIWGPKYAPDFGDMGSPSLADIDDDGLPEILISSKENMTVFEADGTVKWTADIRDNSGVTTATVFDFEDDGLYEVVHMDERDIRIFDGLTGVQLYETRNTSRTVYEIPVVADIDGDKQAEIIITGFDDDLVGGVTPGIRVFKARNGAWADAGSVWGSQSFHVSEISEDSTIPLLETPSWLTHNTYRVQRSPQPDPLGRPDFTVGDLRLIDQGPGNNPSVQVRVGNAGPVDAHEPPWVGVYRGDPTDGGLLLAETRLDTLRAARFQIVNLGEVPLTGSGDLYAVVDQRGRAEECREGNNDRVVPFAAANGQGTLALGTDALSYRPGQPATILATVSNGGGVPADFTIELSIVNAQNQTVEIFDPLPLPGLPAAVEEVVEQLWFTGDALGGSYTVRGRLLDGQGGLVDTASTVFTVAGDTSEPAAMLRLLTDKASYRPDEPVTLSIMAQNISDADIIRAPQILIDIVGSTGSVQQRSFVLDDLFPGARFEAELTVSGAGAAGIYMADGTLRSNLTNTEIATSSAQFERLSDTWSEISGSVEVMRDSLLAGQPQNCLMTVRNEGPAAAAAVPLRRLVVAIDIDQVVWQHEDAVDFPAFGSHVENQAVDTMGLLPGAHACVLETRQGTGWRILDSAAFTVMQGEEPGIEVTPLQDLITSESGSTDSFTVVLRSQPAAAVSVPLESSDAGEWSLLTTQVDFSPATWNIPRTVVVRGVDDDLVDGDQSGSIRLLAAISDDPGYSGFDGPDVAIVNLDNDGARIDVSPLSVETGEDGSAATFLVSISSEPTAEVVVDLTNSDAGEWQLSTGQIVFDAQNWAQPQAVEVTGVDDDEIDGTQTGVIELLPAVSDDAGYAGFDPADVAARNLDDDSAGIRVQPQALTTIEGGAAEAFRVYLDSRPDSDVTIPIGPVDASEWRIDDIEIVLDQDNWNTGAVVLVLPVDDAEPDGDISAVLELGLSTSADPAYAAIDAPDVALTNLDNDGARIVVEPTAGLVVDESGATATFQVSLTEAPTAPVAIPLRSLDDTEFALVIAELEFTPQSFGPQTVTITGLDDSEFDGNVHGLVEVGTADSADSRYDGRNPSDVSVTNLDNESVQVLVTPESALVTDEDGASAVITLRINTAPLAEVRIALVNPDPGEWSIDTSEVVFLPTDWEQPRQVVVTGVDDDEIDGDIVRLIALLPVESDDARFNGIDPRDIPAVNRDNDVAELPAAVLLEALDLQVSEAGDGGQLRVALNRNPTAPLVIGIESADTGEVVVAPTQLLFSAADGIRWQYVTLGGIDDNLADGDQSVELTVRVLESGDPAFANLPARVVTATNLDDDTPRVRLQLTGPQSLTEGESTTLQLSLGSQPTATVDIELQAVPTGFTQPPPGSHVLSPMQVSIDPEDWHTPVQLVLATNDDQIVHPDYRLRIDAATVQSTDAQYAALGSDAVDVEVIDNDITGQPATEPTVIPVDRTWALLLLIAAILLTSHTTLIRRTQAGG